MPSPRKKKHKQVCIMQEETQSSRTCLGGCINTQHAGLGRLLFSDIPLQVAIGRLCYDHDPSNRNANIKSKISSKLCGYKENIWNFVLL